MQNKEERFGYDDLRDFISKMQEAGEVKVIEGASLDEIGPLTDIMWDEPETPLLLFDKIKGYMEHSGLRAI